MQLNFKIFQVLGPKLMENRKPFQLRNVLIVYNFLHVLISIYLFIEGGMAGWFGKYNWRCEPFDPSTDETVLRVNQKTLTIFFIYKNCFCNIRCLRQLTIITLANFLNC